MKIKLVIGSIFVVCMLMLLPSISAKETSIIERNNFLEKLYNKLKDENENNYPILIIICILIFIITFLSSLKTGYGLERWSSIRR